MFSISRKMQVVKSGLANFLRGRASPADTRPPQQGGAPQRAKPFLFPARGVLRPSGPGLPGPLCPAREGPRRPQPKNRHTRPARGAQRRTDGRNAGRMPASGRVLAARYGLTARVLAPGASRTLAGALCPARTGHRDAAAAPLGGWLAWAAGARRGPAGGRIVPDGRSHKRADRVSRAAAGLPLLMWRPCERARLAGVRRRPARERPTGASAAGLWARLRGPVAAASPSRDHVAPSRISRESISPNLFHVLASVQQSSSFASRAAPLHMSACSSINAAMPAAL